MESIYDIVLAISGVFYLLCCLEIYAEAKKLKQNGVLFFLSALFITPIIPALILILKRLDK